MFGFYLLYIINCATFAKYSKTNIYMNFKKDLKITVQRMTLEGKTPEEFARIVCEMTFLGTSKISLDTLFKSEHSPVRSQIFWISFERIPLFIATHFIRHHVGSVPYQLTCRDDRKGANASIKEKLKEFANACLIQNKVDDEYVDILFNEIDRYTPVNLGLLINAQSIIDMFKMRLCLQSHKETVWVTNKLKEALNDVVPELTSYLVPKCVYRGGLCGEPRPCGWNQTKVFDREMIAYISKFNDKQLPKYFK